MTFKINIVGDSGKLASYMYYLIIIIIQFFYTGVGKTTLLLRLMKPEFKFGGRLIMLFEY